MLVDALEVPVGSNLNNRLEIWHRKHAPHLFRMCNPMNQLKEILAVGMRGSLYLDKGVV